MITYELIGPSPHVDTLDVAGGFTITELLVVISLAALLFSTLLPATSIVRDMVAGSAAVATIATATTTARAFATLPKADFEEGGDPAWVGFTYSGAAVLFTPAGQLRLVENDQTAKDLALSPVQLEANGLNGYADVPDRTYLNMSRDAGVVGIARDSNTAPDLFTPPFAVRFNHRGQLIAGRGADQWVYYDGDYDDNYESTTRPASYNPDGWDPSLTTVTTNDGRYVLPFDQIESVIGLIVYSKDELREAGHNHTGNLARNAINAAARDWILANGEVILFSRSTGTMIKR